MAVYLIDTENFQNTWSEILYCAKPDDEIYVFYTDKSPHIHMSHMDFLTACRAKINYVSCFRTDVGGDNALDFQLVSVLGYLIANSIVQQKPTLYFVATCDGGFDAVVRYWRKNNVYVQRLVSDINSTQKLKSGPLISFDRPVTASPVAIKPHFNRIVDYGNAFAKYLNNTLYFEFRFDIAEVYMDLHDQKLPNDKFALAFRNAMARRYGASNNLYNMLKPVFLKIREDEKAILSERALEKSAEKEMPSLPAVVLENAEKYNHESDLPMIDVAAPSTPVEPAKPVKPVKPAALPGDEFDVKRLNALFNSSVQIQTFEKSLKKALPTGLKSCSGELIMDMMRAYDKDIMKWRANYMKRISASGKFDVKALPDVAQTIVLSRWSKSDRSKLDGVVASAMAAKK